MPQVSLGDFSLHTANSASIVVVFITMVCAIASPDHLLVLCVGAHARGRILALMAANRRSDAAVAVRPPMAASRRQPNRSRRSPVSPSITLPTFASPDSRGLQLAIAGSPHWVWAWRLAGADQDRLERHPRPRRFGDVADRRSS